MSKAWNKLLFVLAFLLYQQCWAQQNDNYIRFYGLYNTVKAKNVIAKTNGMLVFGDYTNTYESIDEEGSFFVEVGNNGEYGYQTMKTYPIGVIDIYKMNALGEIVGWANHSHNSTNEIDVLTDLDASSPNIIGTHDIYDEQGLDRDNAGSITGVYTDVAAGLSKVLLYCPDGNFYYQFKENPSGNYINDNEGYLVLTINGQSGNEYIIVGAYNKSQGFIMKVDNAGLLGWCKLYNKSTFKINSLLAGTTTNEFIVAGYTNLNGTNDAFLAYIDINGSYISGNTYGTPFSDRAQQVIRTSDNGFAFGGTTDGKIWVLKTDASGNITWKKRFKGINRTVAAEGRAICQLSSGDLGIIGDNSGYLCAIRTDSVNTIDCFEDTVNVTKTSISSSAFTLTIHPNNLIEKSTNGSSDTVEVASYYVSFYDDNDCPRSDITPTNPEPYFDVPNHVNIPDCRCKGKKVNVPPLTNR